MVPRPQAVEAASGVEEVKKNEVAKTVVATHKYRKQISKAKRGMVVEGRRSGDLLWQRALEEMEEMVV